MTGPFRRLGVVNRGEAALRCVRAVRALRAREGSDLRVVVLYTDVDRDAPFVRHADAAVRLAAAPGREAAAYLDHDAVIAALRRAGADAVWPGWGFVAEDPVFADRVVAEGLRFLGPPGDAMRALGDKIAAKRCAERAGVPVAAWSGGEVADEAAAARAARRIGFPLLVKAAAGGGGRGIRVVEDPAALRAAFRAAAAEARAAFGDGRLFLERRLSGARHVEVQIAADAHGVALALGARDCSVQRRHQKLVEEAPPPGLAATLLDEIAAAAVRLARAVGYVGLGTVEFLVAGGRAWFLEMNPRLQVEHGVTEAITGLDLVALQIRIARGESLAGLEVAARGTAIEARVCAEDPDAGFVPAPGRVARFDPALGPGIRVDAGIAAGSVVPPAFDSLVAKVVATGTTREEARSRLVCALRDLDLVIEGGATNTGFLIDVLEAPEFRRGGVDTGWIDRRGRAAGAAPDPDAADALVAAAIVAYQRRRHDARLNFFADTTNVSPVRVPPSGGQEVDLTVGRAGYRLTVFALGRWRYRVCLDGRAVTVTLREADRHLARLEFADRTRRVAYDATAAGLRLELDGRPYRFGWETTGHVRASTPGMVVALQVAPGERVAAGQVLGFLEAMKVEIGFAAPIAGVVREIRATKGTPVGAGDVLVVLEPDRAAAPAGAAPPRLAIEDEPLGGLAWMRDEIRAVVLGYDADPERARGVVTLLESVRPEALTAAVRDELAALADEVVVFADLEQLFVSAPRAVPGGVVPSSAARLRDYVRRVRAGGAGVAEDFRALLRTALAHYGVASLEHGDALERALLRLFATQKEPDLRRRVVAAVLRCLTVLARAGVRPGDGAALADALGRIAGMRALVGDALADAAIESHAVIVEGPALARQAARAAATLAPWLAAVATDADPPPDGLLDLALAPREVFDDVVRRLGEDDGPRRSLAVAACLLRLHAPDRPVPVAPAAYGSLRTRCLVLPDGRVVVGVASPSADAGRTVADVCAAIAGGRLVAGRRAVDAVELLLPDAGAADPDGVVGAVVDALRAAFPAARCTLSFGAGVHRTVRAGPSGPEEDGSLLGLHPETARRIGFARLRDFVLERLPGGDDLYCFHGRSRTVPEDERLFVLAELRGRAPDGPEDTRALIAAFERLFHRAARVLRATRSARDPRRRLHWNRIAIAVGPAVAVEPSTLEAVARRIAPATRHLGLEKVVVRLRGPEPVELVASDLTGSRLEIAMRPPEDAPLAPAGAYERNVVAARRRRLVYPYEIVRMLTARNGGAPAAAFEEYDLDPASAAPVAVPVGSRPWGENAAGVVFGVLATPTDKVPEGVRRVLILSDPTREMGALAAPECDRIVAAIDLAERLGLPVEWIPVSAGARIAMDDGTENLDATARVVRRIVRFTQAGGVVHVIVYGVNVGAQSYWNALATMLGHTRGALVMTPDASMVLTGRTALEASGGVAAESEVAIGGFERVMGPNGEAQYYAEDLAAAVRTLEEHHRYTYVVPGEAGPRRHRSRDPVTRDITAYPYTGDPGDGFATIGAIFDDATNPGRKRPFAMRAVMQAVIDQDGGHLERWRLWAGAETAIVWDCHLGGAPICLAGIESRNVPREGHRPLDGPAAWHGGTLFPRSSKKVARALNAASGNRPVVVLANLSGFDGSPESLRELQLEHGAEIARAVVNFEGPLVFVVVSRYHGGAYVVFSKALNPRLRALALTGSYASVIGGNAAASAVFGREVRARAAADAAVRRARAALGADPPAAARAAYERVLAEATRAAQAAVAAEFDAVHTVERACRVGSLDEIVEPRALRPVLARLVARPARRGRAPFRPRDAAASRL